MRGFLKEVGWLFGPTLVAAALLLGPTLFLQWRRDAARTSTQDSGVALMDRSGQLHPMSEQQLDDNTRQILYGSQGVLVVLVAFLSVGSAVVRWLTALVERVGRWGK